MTSALTLSGRSLSLHQTLRRDPSDRGALAALSVELAHHGSVPEEIDAATYLPLVLGLLEETPAFSPGRMLYRKLQGLEEWPVSEGDLPRAWREAHEVVTSGGETYCAQSGLPVMVRRRVDGIPMVLVRGGAGELGRRPGSVECASEYHADSSPCVEVALSPFYVDLESIGPAAWGKYPGASPDQTAQPETEVTVTWAQAREYAIWVGGRLLTQAEHERAMRGHQGWSYPWGENPTPPEGVAGEHSPYGLRPVVTNSLDWCEDRTAPSDYAEFSATDPCCRSDEGRSWNSLEEKISALEIEIIQEERIYDYDISSAVFDAARTKVEGFEAEIAAIRLRIEQGEGRADFYRALRGGHPEYAGHRNRMYLSVSGHNSCREGRVTDRYFDVPTAAHGFRVCFSATRVAGQFPEPSDETARPVAESA